MSNPILHITRDWRSHRRFHLLVGVSILVLSFFYGVAAGLNKRLQHADASSDLMNFFGAAPNGQFAIPARIDLPEGVVVAPVGQDVAVNGKFTDMVTFVSNRPVSQLLKDQVARWEGRGFLTVGATSNRQGMAIATDQQTGERYSITAWIVPPTLRRAVSRGYAVQGMVSAGDDAMAAPSLPDEANGQVPGIPLKPGGKGGSVLSSTDAGGRTYTGVYTNPGSISDNVSFYREILSTGGWSETGGNLGGKGKKEFGHLTFSKEGIETVLLFSPVRDQAFGDPKTLITVALGPKDALRK